MYFDQLCCIPKILKNESNSQHVFSIPDELIGCVVSQRYWKMKAIHNHNIRVFYYQHVVLYPKDTEKWKQFTTHNGKSLTKEKLCCIPKILKNESNSQPLVFIGKLTDGCVVSQRYWKMKAIHNRGPLLLNGCNVVLYPKDTEKWKQFTTPISWIIHRQKLCCIPKILKNESNSQRCWWVAKEIRCCVVSQRYWKMKAIHNRQIIETEAQRDGL